MVPGHQLGHDRRVPGGARRRDAAGHVGREHRRQDDLAPALAAREAHGRHHLDHVVGDGAGARDDVEEDVPLRAERHQEDRADVQREADRDEDRRDEREEEDGRGRRSLLAVTALHRSCKRGPKTLGYIRLG